MLTPPFILVKIYSLQMIWDRCDAILLWKLL